MNINKFAIPLSFVTLFFIPIVMYAQSFIYVTSIFTQLKNLIILAVPLLVALALVVFLWGLVVFIYNSGNDQEREVGKQRMIWGLVGLFVVVSVWGLVLLIQELTGVDGVAAGLAPPAIL